MFLGTENHLQQEHRQARLTALEQRWAVFGAWMWRDTPPNGVWGVGGFEARTACICAGAICVGMNKSSI